MQVGLLSLSVKSPKLRKAINRFSQSLMRSLQTYATKPVGVSAVCLTTYFAAVFAGSKKSSNTISLNSFRNLQSGCLRLKTNHEARMMILTRYLV